MLCSDEQILFSSFTKRQIFGRDSNMVRLIKSDWFTLRYEIQPFVSDFLALGNISFVRPASPANGFSYVVAIFNYLNAYRITIYLEMVRHSDFALSHLSTSSTSTKVCCPTLINSFPCCISKDHFFQMSSEMFMSCIYRSRWTYLDFIVTRNSCDCTLGSR